MGMAMHAGPRPRAVADAGHGLSGSLVPAPAGSTGHLAGRSPASAPGSIAVRSCDMRPRHLLWNCECKPGPLVCWNSPASLRHAAKPARRVIDALQPVCDQRLAMQLQGSTRHPLPRWLATAHGGHSCSAPRGQLAWAAAVGGCMVMAEWPASAATRWRFLPLARGEADAGAHEGAAVEGSVAAVFGMAGSAGLLGTGHRIVSQSAVHTAGGAPTMTRAMTPRLPTLARDRGRGCQVVYRRIPGPTPQYRWGQLSSLLGATCWVKHENHTPVGAFKIRGGLTYFDQLAQRGAMPAEVVGATRGNHGQSVGWAARAHGVACTIVVPHGNSVEKNAAMRALGVTLIEHGTDFQESREFAMPTGPRARRPHGAQLPPRPAARRGHLLVGTAQGRAGVGCDLCAHRPGLRRLQRRGCQTAGAGPPGPHCRRGERPCHHLCRFIGSRQSGGGTGHHATGRRHGLPRGRPRRAGPDGRRQITMWCK